MAFKGEGEPRPYIVLLRERRVFPRVAVAMLTVLDGVGDAAQKNQVGNLRR